MPAPGNYFENDDLTDHGTDTLGVLTEAKAYQRMDATIDFDWQGGRPVPAPSPIMKKDIGTLPTPHTEPCTLQRCIPHTKENTRS